MNGSALITEAKHLSISRFFPGGRVWKKKSDELFDRAIKPSAIAIALKPSLLSIQTDYDMYLEIVFASNILSISSLCINSRLCVARACCVLLVLVIYSVCIHIRQPFLFADILTICSSYHVCVTFFTLITIHICCVSLLA